MPAALADIAAYLDGLLHVRETPDYPTAVNGVQLMHRGPVTRVAAAVDASQRAIEGAIAERANLLIVHHGLFWPGVQPIIGPFYNRLTRLISHDIAVYSAHLPLDRHPVLGNNPILARTLGLEASGEFGHAQGIAIGVRGTSDVPTATLLERARAFARTHGGDARASAFSTDRRTRRWAIVTGGGVSPSTFTEATTLGVDTLITGEGPHWSAVNAPEHDLVIIYAGHYATETLGVSALANQLSDQFDVSSTFIRAPTGT